MELKALETIARHLHEEGVRYLVVGGMAVVAHGYGRMTFDIDLVIKLDPENAFKGFQALVSAGYQARQPISAKQFADQTIRDEWIRTKNMVVLNLWSEKFRDTQIDLFVSEPFDFCKAEAEALVEMLPDGTPMGFVNIPTLIQMKKRAGRPKDLDDITHLEKLLHE